MWTSRGRWVPTVGRYAMSPDQRSGATAVKRPRALYRLGCNIVPVHFFEPQRHSQIFFNRAV